MDEENAKVSSNKSKNKIIVWYIINPIAFFISLITLNLGIDGYTYLSGMSEYEFGLGMIFLFPVISFLFTAFMIISAIISLLFESISIKKIINKGNNLFKLFTIIEVFCYLLFIYVKFFI